MAVPKKKKSKAKSSQGKAGKKHIIIMNVQSCANCGGPRHSHHACANCGYYRGRTIKISS